MKSVLITGISGNLGSKLALHLIAQGYRVAGLDIREPEFSNTAESEVEFEKCDLRSPEEIESAVTSLVDRGVEMDVVINNAGVIFSSPVVRFENGQLIKHDFKKWREVIDVTLSAAFYVSACCAESLVRGARKGVIVNVSSICATGNVGQPAYSAAKAGINGLTVALAKELGPLGIRVAALSPGYLETQSTRNAIDDEHLSQIRKRTAIRKLGRVEEFLHAMDFIIQNPYFNGKVLSLDGGLTL